MARRKRKVEDDKINENITNLEENTVNDNKKTKQSKTQKTKKSTKTTYKAQSLADFLF